MKKKRGISTTGMYLISIAATISVFVLCVRAGSVDIPLKELFSSPIIMSIRVPRVICVALSGAGLSVCGAAMQGLLKNPLADGSTLGVSSGAALGAVTAIAFGITFPGIPFAGTVILAAGAAFLSLILILSLSYQLDRTLSTNTIILMGVIYQMGKSTTSNLRIGCGRIALVLYVCLNNRKAVLTHCCYEITV